MNQKLNVVYSLPQSRNFSLVFFQELGVDIKKEATDQDSGFVDESSEDLCGGYIWDPQGDYEQIEAFDYAVSSSCELGFEKVRNRATGSNVLRMI